MQESPVMNAPAPQPTINAPLAARRAPRARRSAAAVVAQYVQDLSRASGPAPCIAA
jgi:hypothetical protein